MSNHSTEWKNWSGNQTCLVEAFYQPKTEKELVEKVRESINENKKIRVVGKGHSWAPLLSDADIIISLEDYNKLRFQNNEHKTLEVQAGMSLAEFAQHAYDLGWMLPNMPNLDVQHMGSILMTATHGAGAQESIIAEHIIACRFIDGQGNIVELKEGDEAMRAMRCSLGGAGIVSTLTVRCVDVCHVNQECVLMHDDVWIADYTELNMRHDHFGIYWFPHTGKALACLSNKQAPICADLGVTDIGSRGRRWWDCWSEKALFLTHYLALHQPWMTPFLQRLLVKMFFRNRWELGPLHKVLTEPHNQKLYSCEYAFPVDVALKVIKHLKQLSDDHELFLPVLFDIRAIAPDKNYLSLAHDHAVVCLGAVIFTDFEQIPDVLYSVEAVYKQYGGRPHLAKVYTLDDVYIRSQYPQLDHFRNRLKKWDPKGVYLTEHLQKILTLSAKEMAEEEKGNSP